MRVHKLKTITHYWDSLETGDKTFEVRLNDRAFQKGDMIDCVRCYENGHYDNPGFVEKILRFEITYILQGGQFGIDPRYCVLGLKRVESEK